MLVQPGRAAPGLGRGLGQPEGRSRAPGPIGLVDRVEAELLGQLESGLDRVDRAGRDALLVEELHPVIPRPGPDVGADQLVEGIPVRDPVGVGRESFVVGQLLELECLEQVGELTLVAGADHHRAFRRREGLERGYGGVDVPGPRRGDPGGEVRGSVVLGRGQRSREQVDRNLLAPAGLVTGEQGGKYRDDRVLAGHHVDHGDPDLGRFPVGLPGDRHQPGDGLDQGVEAREVPTAVLPEARDRAVDDPGVALRDRVVIESEPAHRVRPVVLDQDVGPVGQLPGQGEVAFVLQVEHHRALVPVDRQVVGRPTAIIGRRDEGPGVVPFGRLDLDHVCTEVSQGHRGERPGQNPAEVGYEDSVEDAHGNGR